MSDTKVIREVVGWKVVGDERDEINWSRLPDDELREALRLIREGLSKTTDTAIEEIALEIQQRATRGRLVLVDDDELVATICDDVPWLFRWWPVCLLWRQRPR